jgi:type II secretory pathway pseudopilin PulG
LEAGVRKPDRRKAGFSLIEALIVLVVAGFALMLVFSIGGQAARTGFALGRRALTVADGEISQDELRALVGALVVPPAGVDPAKLKLDPLVGDAQGFAADAVLTRPGLCGPPGPAGRLRIAIDPQAGGDLVTCQARGQAPIVVADLRPRRARFAYSADGASWSDVWSPPLGPHGPAAAQSVFIRLYSDDGRVEWIDRATSGPAWLYSQTQDPQSPDAQPQAAQPQVAGPQVAQPLGVPMQGLAP